MQAVADSLWPIGRAALIEEAHGFAYEAFGQMWVADFLHGPKVRVGKQLKKTYLLAILDDATRYVVYAASGLSEDTAAIIDGLSMAIRRFGIPERFYTDNGGVPLPAPIACSGEASIRTRIAARLILRPLKEGGRGGCIHPVPAQSGESEPGVNHEGSDQAHRVGLEGEPPGDHEPVRKPPWTDQRPLRSAQGTFAF
ncbi:MAG: transposase family protein [Fibrobacterota bacterium]|nr:transposase family protein [Fibrobacterota bacterium]